MATISTDNINISESTSLLPQRRSVTNNRKCKYAYAIKYKYWIAFALFAFLCGIAIYYLQSLAHSTPTIHNYVTANTPGSISGSHSITAHHNLHSASDFIPAGASADAKKSKKEDKAKGSKGQKEDKKGKGGKGGKQGKAKGWPPTFSPTNTPTQSPTDEPTQQTSEPTTAPTNAPTNRPSKSPMPAPTYSPSNAPTDTPTTEPTVEPTPIPTTGNPTTPSPTAPTVAPTFEYIIDEEITVYSTHSDIDNDNVKQRISDLCKGQLEHEPYTIDVTVSSEPISFLENSNSGNMTIEVTISVVVQTSHASDMISISEFMGGDAFKGNVADYVRENEDDLAFSMGIIDRDALTNGGQWDWSDFGSYNWEQYLIIFLPISILILAILCFVVDCEHCCNKYDVRRMWEANEEAAIEDTAVAQEAIDYNVYAD